jgi:hypothetical protein
MLQRELQWRVVHRAESTLSNRTDDCATALTLSCMWVLYMTKSPMVDTPHVFFFFAPVLWWKHIWLRRTPAAGRVASASTLQQHSYASSCSNALSLRCGLRTELSFHRLALAEVVSEICCKPFSCLTDVFHALNHGTQLLRHELTKSGPYQYHLSARFIHQSFKHPADLIVTVSISRLLRQQTTPRHCRLAHCACNMPARICCV